MKSSVRVAVALGAVALATAWMSAPASSSSSGSTTASSTTVGDAAEAWYQTVAVATCSSPIGCPPLAPVSPYPAGTLHVGVLAGQETARTYLRPDLSSLPDGATVHGGTMTLPLDTAGGDGSVAPDTADVKACLVAEPFDDGVDGSFDAPPDIDCNVSSPATYEASGAGAEGVALTLDLGPFADAWSGGLPPLGIALLPATTGDGATWHVVVGSKTTTSSITYVGGAVDQTRTDGSPLDDGALVPDGVGVDLAPTPSPARPTPSSPAPASPSPSAAAGRGSGGRQAAPIAAVGAVGFQYPQALLLPLLLLAAVAWLTRLFLRDATPQGSA